MTAGQPTPPSDRACDANPAPRKSSRPKPRPLGVRLNDAAEMLGLARTTVFAMIRDGRLEGKKIGKATVVTYDSIEAFWASLPAIEATKAVRSVKT